MEFMNKDFLLKSETAKRLYHQYAANMPIIDYHCHIQPKEIYEDRRFENIAQIWLGGKQTAADGTAAYFGDHYKWRVMRSAGVSEEYITGEASDYERFKKFAEILPLAIGNPMYHWCHLELKRYFGYEGTLRGDTSEEVWNYCNDKLQNDTGFTVRGLIRRSNVAFIGTTDDPTDDLSWHAKLQADDTAPCVVAPSFRPDKAILANKPGFSSYLQKLADSAQVQISSVSDVILALEKRLDVFVSLGCRASDHGLDYIPFTDCTEQEADAVFAKAMRGESITDAQSDRYQTYILTALGRMYYARDIVMQLHYSCQRNVNHAMFEQLGPDTGFDAIAITNCAQSIGALLSKLSQSGECPKTILYSLNSSDFDSIGTVIGCFQSSEIPGKIQMGSAWWFCDTKDGMEQQMRSLARLSLLGTFVGMLTDSRSFLSYTRHEYFRRILCNMIGEWVENGEYPADYAKLESIVRGVCTGNAKRYFNL